jgi:phage terminase large subunit-like protein
MVSIGQTISMMAEAVKRIEECVVSRTLRHGGHPVLRWMASNCETVSDPYGNRKIVKPKEGGAKRVDGMVALEMAVARDVRQPSDAEPELWIA